MSAKEINSGLRKAISVYQFLLSLYPKEYQKEYAQQMLIVFKDLYKEQMAEKGRIGLGFWVKAMSDVLVSAIPQQGEALADTLMKRLTSYKISKSFIFFLCAIVLVNFIYFAPVYFLDKYIVNVDNLGGIFLFLLPYLVISFVFWITKPIGMFKKPFVIFSTVILSAGTGFAMILLPMFLPGSKEHNYIMYEVCMPALEKYYKEKGSPMAEEGDQNAQGEFRWFVQHTECEENVRAGKGPVFSENPPGFAPRK